MNSPLNEIKADQIARIFRNYSTHYKSVGIGSRRFLQAYDQIIAARDLYTGEMIIQKNVITDGYTNKKHLSAFFSGASLNEIKNGIKTGNIKEVSDLR